tara:strand:+ start:639 stop:1118 length:480 start_codon:yes stop_codon:yes gene_type:complete
MIKGLITIAGVTSVFKQAKEVCTKVSKTMNTNKEVNIRLQNIEESINQLSESENNKWVLKQDFDFVMEEYKNIKNACVYVLNNVENLDTKDFWETMNTVDGKQAYHLGQSLERLKSIINKDIALEIKNERQERIAEFVSGHTEEGEHNEANNGKAMEKV